MRITDSLGSDVSATPATPAFTKPRRRETPGIYLVPGSCTLFPRPESVRGTLDAVAVSREYFARFRESARLVIDGRIREVASGGAARAPFQRALRRAAGGDYGYVIHFTNGIHPAARATRESFIEDIRARGNNAVGVGVFSAMGRSSTQGDRWFRIASGWFSPPPGSRKKGVIVEPAALARAAEQLVRRIAC